MHVFARFVLLSLIDCSVQVIRAINAHADNFVDMCFTSLLEHWLTQTPSCSDLIKALKSPVISREDIAFKIEALLVRLLATLTASMLRDR